jgi:hypothetical protein
MSLSDTLTLDNATGTESTFALQGRDSSGARRIDTASTLSEPQSLVIKHSRSGQGLNAVDRHLVQVAKTELDSNGIARTAIVNFTMAVPQSTVFTSTEILNMAGFLVDLITDGGWSGAGFAGTTALTQLLRNES